MEIKSWKLVLQLINGTEINTNFWNLHKFHEVLIFL